MPTIHELREHGTSLRKIAALLRISRNTVRRHLRGLTPRARPAWHARARALFLECRRNGAEVARRLRSEGWLVSVRSVQRVVRGQRVVAPVTSS